MTTATRNRVKAGAKKLDKLVPNWFKKVKLTKLNMQSGIFEPDAEHSCGCILAQLDAGNHRPGYYNNGVTDILAGVSSRRQIELGFWADTASDYGEWDDLTEDWKDEIRKRRGK